MRRTIAFLKSRFGLNSRIFYPGKISAFQYRQNSRFWSRLVLMVIMAVVVTGQSFPAHGKKSAAGNAGDGKSADEFLVVDCLLPGQLRKMGSRMNYLSPRRPVKTSASDCEIRGGEYVAFDRADYSTALKIWLPRAKEGDPVAQTYVGEIYEKGLGLDPDYQFAAYWYQQAVEQGHSRALINLGHLYELGLGVERDPRKALNMYRQASGIEGDKLLFASSLVSTHVPKEQYQSVQGALAAEKQHSTELQRDLALLQRDMTRRSAQLEKTRAQLAFTAEKITELTSANPAAGSGITSKAEAELAGELQALESERNQLQRQVAQLNRNNQQLQQSSASLAAQLSETEHSQNQYQQQLQQLQQETRLSQQRVRESERVVVELNQQLAQQQDQQSISETELQQLQFKIDTRNAALVQAREQHLALERSIKKSEKKLQTASEEYARKSQQTSGISKDSDVEKQRLAAQLQDTGYQLLMAKAALQMERAKVSQVAGQTAEQQAEVTRQRTELAQLSAQLEQQYSLAKTQQGKISELQTQSLAVKAEQSATVDVDERVADLGASPRIEIIEPPVVLVRSMPTVRLLSNDDERQLVGKVLAPAGILSLSVNGKPVELGGNNLFHTNIPVDIAPKPVNVVVVDKQGRRAAVTFTFVEESSDGKPQAVASVSKPPSKKARRKARFKMGDYHALVIGNNDYQQFSTLATAVNDARETEKLLREKYSFKTKLLLNADRYTILSALNELRETLDEDDNLLIYYAGHGMLDDTNDRGYWLPVDADVSNNANWISNTAITDILNVINAKHILVVADSCFSGTLTQSPLARAQVDVPADVRSQWIELMAETRARITLTSGGLEPVLDGGGGDHSLFSKAFLATLRDNDDILEGYSLYYQILSRMGSDLVSPIAQRTGQVPQYAPIHLAGHESGEFFFSPI